MAKQQTEPIADDLMADSLQAENYLKQGENLLSGNYPAGIGRLASSLLYRYQKASPDLRFKIFLYSSFL